MRPRIGPNEKQKELNSCGLLARILSPTSTTLAKNSQQQKNSSFPLLLPDALIPTASSMTTLTPGPDGSGPFSGPAASLHVGPDGITAPGIHLGADGLSLATPGAGVVDPGQAAAAAAMLNAAAASSGVRALRLNADGLQVNPGAPDSTTLKLNGDGIAITAPRVGGSGGGANSPSSEQATVQLKLPNAASPNGSVNAGIAALAPRLAFSVVPDSASGAEISVGSGAGRGAAAGAATSAALGNGNGSPISVGQIANAPDPNKNGGISASAAGVRVGIPTVNALPTPVGG